jgi:lipoprotein-anchoring transpeptidase ErfK/SrfK
MVGAMQRAGLTQVMTHLAIAAALAGSLSTPSSGEPRPPNPDEIQIEEQPGYKSDEEARLPLPFQRQVVFFRTTQPRGTLIIDTPKRFLYLVLGNNHALRYGISVGHDCLQWQGLARISHETEWPDWTTPPDASARHPEFPNFVAGGAGNPLGARVIEIGDNGYRIQGTNQPEMIGHAVSSGCFRLVDTDVIHLFQRAPVGARVLIVQAPEM